VSGLLQVVLLALVCDALLAKNLVSLRIVPPDVVLAGTGRSQKFLVLARDVDGNETDVTGNAQLHSSAPNVVALDSRLSVFAARSRGQATIKATLSGLQTSATVRVADRPTELAVQFSPDVISVLTIKGCNNSGCHGSPAGQNGFRLSLFGYDVAADRDMILKAHGGRRVDFVKPENSLLLRKPLFEVAHGGGRVLTKDSDEYRTLLNWLQQGGKLDSDGARVSGIEVYPSEQVLAGKGVRMGVVVIGRLSDGTTRDMTGEVRYSSSDGVIAAIRQNGEITAGEPGIATVLARGMGKSAAIQVIVVHQPAGDNFPKLQANNFIDELTYRMQRKLNVRPAPLSSDREFVRRVFLDSIGTLPTPEEVDRFVHDTDHEKRSKLIDSLLSRPEYADFWTVKFEDWFRNNQLNSQGRSMGIFKEWIREWLSEDRPYDQVVRELITSKGDTFRNPAANFWHPAADFMLKRFDLKKVTPTVSRLFLGVRLECAECHNHPLENFTQDDFYGVSAFFGRMRVKHGTAEYRRTWYLDEDADVEHPVTKRPVPPKFLNGSQPELERDEDRRIAFADWLTSPANAYFARATVNRIWNEYFQTGIVEPFDDFRSTNPPTNPELLDRLADHFADSGFRLKSLHRTILNSRTYQLSSRREKGGNGPLERLVFAGYQPRQLAAEVLLDAISQVTGAAHEFGNYPSGTRAMQVHVPDQPDYFLVTFGLPRRDVLCERVKSPTLGQALHMINGATVLQKVQTERNIMSELLSKGWTDDRITQAVYLRAYSRSPSERESQAIREFIEAELAAGRSRLRALEGVLWTVLNSMEFKVNH
jgi:hypothetical protein